jgi:hypothetical protein
MKARYLLIASLALSPVAGVAEKDGACNVVQQDLLGYWAGNGPFEEMQFTQEAGANVFNSWLHQRPDHLGAAWKLSGCRLTIIPRAEPPYPYEFTVRMSGRALRLIDSDYRSVSTYRRLPEPQ